MFKSVFKTGIAAHYSVSQNPSFVAEPWSIYPAKHRSTSRKVSVFIFDKKKFENGVNQATRGSSSKSNKVLLEDAYAILKATITNLTKFKHPNILTIIESIEEHKANIMFVTEFVVGSLVSVGSLEDVIIQKGLLQISQGLEFFHSNCNIVHLNLQPNSIFINENSDWKISGLGFIKNLNEMSSSEINGFYLNNYDAKVPQFLNLNLNYTAPEIIFDNNLNINNDIFSLGCLIYYLYNGETFLRCENSMNFYKEQFKSIENKFNKSGGDSKFFYKKIPDILFPILPKLTQRLPYDRLSIQDFLNSAYFNNPLIKSLIFIDEFPSKTEDEKLIFFKGLINLLPLFPNQILQQKFLPILIEVVDNKIETSLISTTLKIILVIGKTLSSLTFHDKITPTLTKVVEFEDAQLILIEEIDILNKKMSKKDLIDLLKPLMEKVLIPTANPLLQEKLLKKFESIVDVFDFPYIKNDLFPKVCAVFSKTTSLTIKVATINTFELFVTHKTIDRYIIEESLLPLLKKLKTREPIVLLSLLEFYDEARKSLETSVIVEEIIPQLWKLSISNTLSVSNYKDFLIVMHNIQNDIEEKQLQTLSGLNNGSVVDTKEKFTKLLYSERPKENGPKEPVLPSIKPTRMPSVNNHSAPHLSTPSSTNAPRASSTSIASSMKSIQPLQLNKTHSQPKIEPLIPSSKMMNISNNNITGNTKNELSFGSTGVTQKVVMNLELQSKKVKQDDEFGEFSQSTAISPAKVNIGTSGIDWSSELYKNSSVKNVSVIHNVISNASTNGQANANANANGSGFPPGFSMQLVPSSNRPGTVQHSQPDFSLI